MGAARPLLTLILAVVLALAVYSLGQHVARHRVQSTSMPREGFAGWLLVLAGSQWLALLLLLAAFVRHLASASDQPASLPLRLVIDGLLLAFVAMATILMMRRSSLYPRLLRLELVLLVVLPPLDAAWLGGGSGTYVTEPKLWIAVSVRLAATSMVAAAFYLYSQHSRRMRATFVR